MTTEFILVFLGAIGMGSIIALAIELNKINKEMNVRFQEQEIINKDQERVNKELKELLEIQRKKERETKHRLIFLENYASGKYKSLRRKQ